LAVGSSVTKRCAFKEKVIKKGCSSVRSVEATDSQEGSHNAGSKAAAYIQVIMALLENQLSFGSVAECSRLCGYGLHKKNMATQICNTHAPSETLETTNGADFALLQCAAIIPSPPIS